MKFTKSGVKRTNNYDDEFPPVVSTSGVFLYQNSEGRLDGSDFLWRKFVLRHGICICDSGRSVK